MNFVSLETSAFEEAVLRPVPAIAVFDCDGTLWSGDAGSGFMQWTIETGLVSREVVDSIDRRYRGYLHGEVSELTICGEMMQMYQGLREDEMRRAAKTFFVERIQPRVFADMMTLLERLRTAGTEIWAVSSTNNWVIEEGVREFGIAPEQVLAARVKIASGVVTNELLDVPTDEGKAESLRRAGVNAPDAVFGNSVHDTAMLAMARRPFAVNPTTALVERAQADGWAIYLPHAMRALPDAMRPLTV